MTRWSTLLLDEADLATMAQLPQDAVHHHMDDSIRHRLSSRALYRRWEQQQWSAEDLTLERDAEQWKRLPPETRHRLEKLIINFLIGEYTGLDLLGPILLGCPDEDSLVYLGTQLADESRHTRLMQRLSVDVLGLPADLQTLLPEVWNRVTPAQRQLSTLETDLIQRISGTHSAYEDWLRAVAVFHVVTEGVLAVNAQRELVGSLRPGGILSGLRAGFVAMTRDESRHVAYGMQAIRRGLKEGHAEAITDALCAALPLALLVDVEDDMSADEWAEAQRVAFSLRQEALRRLRQLDMPQTDVARLSDVMDRTLRELAGARSIRTQTEDQTPTAQDGADATEEKVTRDVDA